MIENLVLCPFETDKGLISRASQMFGKNFCAVVPQGQAETAGEYGAAHIVEFCAGQITDEGSLALFFTEKIQRWGCRCVLAPATIQMRSIMSMTAWHLHAGLTADCTDIGFENGRLIQTRPAFGNALMADILSLSGIQMATVRPDIFQPQKNSFESPSQEQLCFDCEGRIKQIFYENYPGGKLLSQAQIVIAGGMGIGSKDGFEKLGQLAKRLGAGIGASRAAVNAGFAPYHCQIGMTGVTVCPRLYIAIGISGAVQHLAGMFNSVKIVAINSDPDAAIFNYSDYGIVGDWNVIIDELIKETSYEF